MDALQSLEAKEVVRSYPEDDAPLDDLLCCLRQRFGRPQIVVPLLVQKIVKPMTFTNTYDGLRSLTDQVLMGYDSLKPFIGDSLSQFLTYLAKASFDKSLRDDWEKYASDKLDKPTLDNLRTFVDKRLLHMSPTSNPPYKGGYDIKLQWVRKGRRYVKMVIITRGARPQVGEVWETIKG